MMAFSTLIAPSSSSPSSSTPPSSYEVFLSFRGKDTRLGFVDHLHKAFQQRGFIVFKDDKKLEPGSPIAKQLSKAIKESQYAVVVISETFADSKWCLNELIEILKCKSDIGLRVLPVFYHVDPADVRHQRRTFAQAFDKHREKRRVDEEKLKAWAAALEEVADLSGWHVGNSAEATIVEEITTMIFQGLRLNQSEIFKDLFGIKSRVEELKSLLCLQMDDVRFIGIHGMGGIGKTTLARALYNYVRCEFNASSFVCCGKDQGSSLKKLQQQIIHEILEENNTEIYNSLDGLEKLRQRLHNKKVFIVFDDANHDQLNALAGSPKWFGKGSRIIVTGRESQLWKSIVSESNIYVVDPLGFIDALELFCRKAFNSFNMENDFGQLFQEAFSLFHRKAIYEYGFNMEDVFVEPLAHVLRSLRFLPCGLENDFAQLSVRVIRSVGYLPLGLEVIGSSLHDEKIDVWKSTFNGLECLEDDVFSKLRISYNGLNELQKEMFLDVACFFTGALELKIRPIFESLGYNPKVNFEVLKKKSLIKISREGKIWMHDLLREIGQRIVNQLSPMEPGNRSRLWSNQEIIHVLKNNSGTSAVKGIVRNSFSFSKVEELNCEAFSQMKTLRILILGGNRKTNITWVGNQSNLILSNELCVLEWLKFPLESLPESFQSDNLFKLSMQYSKIKVLWHTKKTFNKLKCIDLSHSEDLTEFPDLSEVQNLEELKFAFCKSLKIVHPSIATLKRLLHLDLSCCQNLERLPGDICWESLVHLDLFACQKLQNFPKNVGIMTSLQNLNLSYCELLDEEFLRDVGSLSSLQNLYLVGENVTKIPDSLYLLPQLKSLHIFSCSLLQTLPKLPLSLSDLRVVNSSWQEMEGGASVQLCVETRNGFWPLDGRASVWFSVATDGTPYKILQRNSDKLEFNLFDNGEMFAWGPALEWEVPGSPPFFMELDGDYAPIREFPGCLPIFVDQDWDSEVPVSMPRFEVHPTPRCKVTDWIKHKSAEFFWRDVDSKELIVGIALFVDYEIGEHDISDSSTFGDGNPTCLEFTWQFRASQPSDFSTSLEETCLRLVCRVPEVPLVGPNRFWAFIPARFFAKTGIYLDKCRRFEISIKNSWKGRAPKSESRLVCKQDVSEFFDVLDNISPQGLKLRSFEDFSLGVLHGKYSSDYFEDENESLDCEDEYV